MATQTMFTSAEKTFDEFLAVRKERGVSSDREKLRTAFHIAASEYGDAPHWTGESMLEHCLGVLRVYLQFDPDDDAVIACLLHHLVDLKRWTLAEIEKQYGTDVRDMISGEFLLSHGTMENRRMSIEHLRLMFLKVSGDLRLVLLILSQHLHLLERLEHLDEVARRRACRDALTILAPVAARLGVYKMKHQLESKAFPVMYPVDAVRIAEQMEALHRKHGDFLPKVAEHLAAALEEAGLRVTVEAREKQPYSIFHKMKTKSESHVEDLYDLFALRVIVADEAECYQALGVLHRIGHPLAGRFKDYIAFPKPNGYKSLHTTLARLPGVPDGVFIEAQIRTAQMQREAELGLAAHWSYKEGGAASIALARAQVQLALAQSSEEKPMSDGSDQIFVLTPHNDVIELPEGATPLDFAFHVHTTLGLSFKAAKVNGSIVAMDRPLENGDIVEILRHPDARPSPRWITLLKTASARSRLKKFLTERERLLAPSDETVVREMRSARPPKRPMPKGKVVRFVAKTDGGIAMPVVYAKCCKPSNILCPDIAGVIGRSGDVRVHCAACKMLKNVNAERKVGVQWMEG